MISGSSMGVLVVVGYGDMIILLLMTILLRLIETVTFSDKLSRPTMILYVSRVFDTPKNVYAATTGRLFGNGNGKEWECKKAIPDHL